MEDFTRTDNQQDKTPTLQPERLDMNCSSRPVADGVAMYASSEPHFLIALNSRINVGDNWSVSDLVSLFSNLKTQHYHKVIVHE